MRNFTLTSQPKTPDPHVYIYKNTAGAVVDHFVADTEEESHVDEEEENDDMVEDEEKAPGQMR